MKNIPLNIFVKGTKATELESNRQTALAILKHLNEHNKTATDAEKEARQSSLDAAMAKVAPAPFRLAEIEPGQNYWTERRAHNNPRPENEVLPIQRGPAQLATALRMESYGTGVPQYVPPSRPAAPVGSG